MTREARRRFLGVLGGMACAPLARAQRPPRPEGVKRLGMLFVEPQPPEESLYRTIAGRLKELGWVEGRNLHVERAYADADQARLPALAEGLLRKGMDVIFADDAPPAIELKRATATTPIVFHGVAFPVEAGLVSSLARPGGNVTGVATTVGGIEITAKRVEVLREIVPKARRLAWILTPDLAGPAPRGHRDVTSAIAAAIKGLGFQTTFYLPSGTEEFETAFRQILAARNDAVSVGQSALLIKNRQRIVDFSLANGIPGTYFDHTFVPAGGLVSYGPDFAVGWRTAADCIDRIFRGARPADLPVALPSVMTLQVNLRTAAAMGLTIPQTILARADRVME